MLQGMMWQSNVKRPLIERVSEALAYYRRKYGVPDAVYVNPKLLDGNEMIVDGVSVKPMRIPLGQLWICAAEAAAGVERESERLLAEAEAL